MSQWIKLLAHQFISGTQHKAGEYVYVGNQYAEQLIAAKQAVSMIAEAEPITGDTGIVYVVYGAAAIKEARGSLVSLRLFHPELKALVISDGDTGLEAEHVYHVDDDVGARAAKLAAYDLSPFDKTLYLDADTVIIGPLNWGFRLLDSFDLIVAIDIAEMAKDGALHPNSFGYTQEERSMTTYLLPTTWATQFACGMLFFRKSHDTQVLFDTWQDEWRKWQGRDQAAFLRALCKNPTRILAVPSEWNVAGSKQEARIVHHRWGAARRPE